MAKQASCSIQLQERDLDFLQGLFESRVMTSKHIAELYFDQKHEYTKKRLQQIKGAGLVRERKRRLNERAILSLTGKGFLVLKDAGRLDSYPTSVLRKTSFEARSNVSEATLRHELQIMDIKGAFFSTIDKTEQFSITDFVTWPLLCQFEASPDSYSPLGIVQPDGFIRIHEKEPGTQGFSHDLFLELDRSSEKLDILVNRSLCYLNYYKSGGFAVRNGATPHEFKEFPFRVLVVLKTAERRNNLTERLFQNIPPILGLTWLTTIREAAENPAGKIWVRPDAYRNAIKGTRFFPDTAKVRFAYSRNSDRDLFVEERVPKFELLEV